MPPPAPRKKVDEWRCHEVKDNAKRLRWHCWLAFPACCTLLLGLAPDDGDSRQTRARPAVQDPFARENLVAWCIVPFDAKKRGPEERAAMLRRLGVRRLAYDYRAEHIPTFDAEMEALKRHGIELVAWWFPTTLNDEARRILDVLKRHGIRAQLWVTGGGGPVSSEDEQRRRVAAEAERIRPIAAEAAKIGCTVALYNHGGWFGEPENQLAIIEHLKLTNVGIVYNLHHGHDHLARFPELLRKMKPHLMALNLNGMVEQGDRRDMKILPLGAGDRELELLRVIRDSGYRGPIGILNHTDHDAEARLSDNLDGLDWLLPQLDGKSPGPRPKYRTYSPPQRAGTGSPASRQEQPQSGESRYVPELVARILAEAKATGDARRGAEVFRAPQFACLSCHRVGGQGGTVGPELTAVADCLSPDQIAESVLWPKRQIKDEYVAHAVVTTDGKLYQGYKNSEDDRELALRDSATGDTIRIPKSEIEERRVAGTLMPDGLAEAMSGDQLRDLVRFLMGLNRKDGTAAEMLAHAHRPATFSFDRAPLRSEHWPNWQHPVNRDRLYDFYAKEAEYFMKQPSVPLLLPEYPGVDGGQLGHWGNQNEATWADNRWNETVLGTVQCGVFRGAGVTVPRGVCVRLGERGELSACFNPETLCYEALWQGGFVKFSSVRHGFLDGLIKDGTALARPEGRKPDRPFVYRGFYRNGKRVIFSYRIGDQDYLDAPWVENGRFTRTVAPAGEHPLSNLTRGGPAQWPQVMETRGTLGNGDSYVVDTVAPPFDNPWKSLMFFGDHDFFADGTALLCTMQGDVWRVEGLDVKLDHVRWRRVAAGLHHAQGLVIADGEKGVGSLLPERPEGCCAQKTPDPFITVQGQVYVLGRDQGEKGVGSLLPERPEGCCAQKTPDPFITVQGQVYVLGRDQITRMHDFNGDGEMDFYECFTNAFATSPAGHDFICGLERDAAGNFYTVSGNQGLVRISPDGRRADVLATGFRNPDGLGLLQDGSLTVPCSEGEWTPASMICLVRGWAFGRSGNENAVERKPSEGETTNFFGYGGPRSGRPPDLPLVYLPRGLDNSSGAQVYGSSDRWGPLQGQLIHFSFGAGSHFLVLRDEVAGQPQGAIVPLAGEFLSGAHRGAFNPNDGQLYVTGMAGWGTYTPHDGSFQRVRFTGKPAQLPIAFRAHQNGVRVSFSEHVDRAIAEQPKNQFAQAWNYRYSAAYGSPEFSPRHPGMPGHDPLGVASAHVLSDGRSVFLELPDLQPVNQLHLHLRVDSGPAHDLFATIHKLAEPFTEFPGYRPVTKQIAAHPILTDMATSARSAPNPWRKTIRPARSIHIEAGKNLTFTTKSVTVRAGEPIQLVFKNPDVVPHNWVLAKPGTLERVGDLANKLVADPEAAVRHYVPRSEDVLVYSDVVTPQSSFTIYFQAPREKGRYPFLCTFPGHWMVMNGQMIVEE